MIRLIVVIMIILLIYINKYTKQEYYTNYNKKISFCITCLNRFDQIKIVLPINLKKNIKYSKDIEFVLVNFIIDNEGKKIDKWIRKNLNSYIKSGYLKYYVTNKLKMWHAPIAKNTSHIYSSGEIVYNLDCDNYVENKEIDYLLKLDLDNNIYYGWSGTWKDGTGGRVCTKRSKFLEIGGYDQNMLPSGYQDLDLLYRLKHYYNNNIIIAYKNNIINKAIINDKELNTKFIKTDNSWQHMELNNKKRSKMRIKNNDFINNHKLGVKATRIMI